MDYYFSKLITASFPDAITRTTEALKAEGFGIISEIDMRQKLKEKLGVDFQNYMILGACNPSYAYKALLVEEKIGTMLPCNVIVMEKENGWVEVSAVNPIASMMAIHNDELETVATEVTDKLKRVVSKL